ncbi:MAG: HD domain-containing protein [Bacilli bacterium]|nr:HD domain-containing protein [Bacilli bacterium]
MLINEFTDGCRVDEQFLIVDSKKGVTANGAGYMNVTLQDATGTIEGKKWDYAPGDEEILAKGLIVQISGAVNRYKTQLQLKIFSVTSIPQDNIDWTRFVSSAPVSIETMKEKLRIYIDSIEDPDIKALVEAMVKRFGDKYLTYPAAVRNHHDYVSGLLYHSLTMADMAAKVCRVYPSLNRDVVLGGVIIHDMGKTIELSGANATSFTLEGKLLGHISIGQAELRSVAKELGMYAFDDLPLEQQTINHPLFRKKEIAVVFEHIVLSHHSKPEFGSPVMPVTRESFVIGVIDDLDAKMMILDKAFKDVEKGGSTAKLFNMDDRYFYLPTFSKPAYVAGTSVEEEKDDLK